MGDGWWANRSMGHKPMGRGPRANGRMSKIRCGPMSQWARCLPHEVPSGCMFGCKSQDMPINGPLHTGTK